MGGEDFDRNYTVGQRTELEQNRVMARTELQSLLGLIQRKMHHSNPSVLSDADSNASTEKRWVSWHCVKWHRVKQHWVKWQVG